MKAGFKYLWAGALLGSSMAAQAQPDWFVGAALTHGKLEGEFKDGLFGDSDSISETDTGLSLRAGTHLQNGRAYGSVGHTSYDGLTLISLTGSYDFVHAINGSLSLYAGATAGLGRFDLDDFDAENSYVLGIQLGAAFRVTEQINVDVSAFYQKVDVKYKESYTFMNQTFSDKVTIDTLSGVRVGIDFMF